MRWTLLGFFKWTQNPPFLPHKNKKSVLGLGQDVWWDQDFTSCSIKILYTQAEELHTPGKTFLLSCNLTSLHLSTNSAFFIPLHMIKHTGANAHGYTHSSTQGYMHGSAHGYKHSSAYGYIHGYAHHYIYIYIHTYMVIHAAIHNDIHVAINAAMNTHAAINTVI